MSHCPLFLLVDTYSSPREEVTSPQGLYKPRPPVWMLGRPAARLQQADRSARDPAGRWGGQQPQQLLEEGPQPHLQLGPRTRRSARSPGAGGRSCSSAGRRGGRGGGFSPGPCSLQASHSRRCVPPPFPPPGRRVCRRRRSCVRLGRCSRWWWRWAAGVGPGRRASYPGTGRRLGRVAVVGGPARCSRRQEWSSHQSTNWADSPPAGSSGGCRPAADGSHIRVAADGAVVLPLL
jgi:hypothetical protein